MRYVYEVVYVNHVENIINTKTICVDKRRAAAIASNLNFGLDSPQTKFNMIEEYQVREIPFDQLEFCKEDCCRKSLHG
ncbi:MAG: hypothetical protein V3U54_08425 [Thermodesulfobacteriota bacterium]